MATGEAMTLLSIQEIVPFLKTVFWHFKLLPDSGMVMLTASVLLKYIHVFVLSWKASIVKSCPQSEWGDGWRSIQLGGNVQKHSAALCVCVCECVRIAGHAWTSRWAFCMTDGLVKHEGVVSINDVPPHPSTPTDSNMCTFLSVLPCAHHTRAHATHISACTRTHGHLYLWSLYRASHSRIQHTHAFTSPAHSYCTALHCNSLAASMLLLMWENAALRHKSCPTEHEGIEFSTCSFGFSSGGTSVPLQLWVSCGNHLCPSISVWVFFPQVWTFCLVSTPKWILYCTLFCPWFFLLPVHIQLKEPKICLFSITSACW